MADKNSISPQGEKPLKTLDVNTATEMQHVVVNVPDQRPTVTLIECATSDIEQCGVEMRDPVAVAANLIFSGAGQFGANTLGAHCAVHPKIRK